MLTHLQTIKDRLRHTYRDDALWAAIDALEAGVLQVEQERDRIVGVLLDEADVQEGQGQGVAAVVLCRVADRVGGVEQDDDPFGGRFITDGERCGRRFGGEQCMRAQGHASGHVWRDQGGAE